MSKDQKANAIKIIFANEFRFEPDEIEFEKTPTVAQRVVRKFLWFFGTALLILTVIVFAAICHA